MLMVIFLIFMGLCLGSFVNALVWRLHEKRDWVSERSECVHCHHQLHAKDLLPVISWLLLRGRCRYCHKPISTQYPLVETVTAALFAVSYVFWPYGFGVTGSVQFGLWLLILTGLVALFVYDLRWMLLPNKIVFTLAIIAGLHALVGMFDAQPLVGYAFKVILSLAVASGIFYLLFQLSGGRWIGGGDVKLGLAYGLLLADPLLSAMVIFLASLIGTVLILPSLIFRRIGMDTKLPFGPLLITAVFISYIWGPVLIEWYAAHFILY